MNQIRVGCTGKKRFNRFALAAKCARRMNRNDDGAHAEAYHCRHCNGFHIGEDRGYRVPDKRREVGV